MRRSRVTISESGGEGRRRGKRSWVMNLVESSTSRRGTDKETVGKCELIGEGRGGLLRLRSYTLGMGRMVSLDDRSGEEAVDHQAEDGEGLELDRDVSWEGMVDWKIEGSGESSEETALEAVRDDRIEEGRRWK